LLTFCKLTFFEKKVSKETLIAIAPLNSLLNGATAYKVLGALHPLRAGAAHPLRALLTSFSKEVS